MILDSNSILNRAFFGMPPLTTKAGVPTNAVYGFLNILLKLMEDEKPDGIVAAFDVKEKTFRHAMYEGYKAQRKAMAPELSSQIPIAKQLLDAMGILRIERGGFEGDDIGRESRADSFFGGRDGTAHAGACYVVCGRTGGNSVDFS